MPKKVVAPTEHEPTAQSIVAVNSGSAVSRNIRNIPLIIGREYKTRVRQRSFAIITFVMMLLIIIGAFLPTIFSVLSSKAQMKMAVVNTGGTVAELSGEALRKYIDTNLNTTSAPTTNTGKAIGTTASSRSHFVITTASADKIESLHQQVKSNELDILLVITRTTNGNLSFTYYTNENDPQSANVAQVQTLAGQLNLLDKLSRRGVASSQVNDFFGQPQFKAISTVQEKSGRTPAESIAASIITFAAIILIFMAVQIYSVGVAGGVAEEKGTRVMEVLINATTPFQLLTGKIIGVGLVGLTQMVILSTAGIGVLLLQAPLKAALLGNASSATNIDITALSINILLMVVVYFILGFLLFASLYAGAGALVKRQEEVSGAVAPLLSLVMVGYFASFYAAITPDAAWVTMLSFVPFFTPMMMLVRVGAGTVSGWEIVISIVIMMVSIFICAQIAARIYRFGVLMYGQKPGFGQVIKLIRAKNSYVAE